MKVPEDFDFKQRLRESDEEGDAEEWAEDNGWFTRPMQYRGRRGCPDRMFVGHGHLILAEFKKPDVRNKKDGGLSGNQVEERKRFKAAGIFIPVFYTAAECIAYLKRKM